MLKYSILFFTFFSLTAVLQADDNTKDPDISSSSSQHIEEVKEKAIEVIKDSIPEAEVSVSISNVKNVNTEEKTPVNYKGNYIRFGNAMSSSEGAKGSISNLDFSLFSIKQLIIGASLEQGLYSYKGGNWGKISQVRSFASEADFNNLYRDIDKIKGFTSTTNGFLTLMYDVGKPRGLYFIGGVGYGLRAKVRGSLKDLAHLASIIDSGKSPQDLINDPDFINTINSLSKNPSDLVDLINQILPGNTDLISQVDTPEKIKGLLNSGNLDRFINDAQGRFDSSSLDKLNSLNAVCNTLITCDWGMSYTLGVGYDLPIYKAIGLDLQAKSRYMANSQPIYSLGANLIFRW
ncbi:MAG: hypothetical protein LBH40_06800 [Alphaproteobacteria bacterium]|jgi:hypothetical protein|nr:hypothetical protein [Alphaproteobacteria bacterium]